MNMMLQAMMNRMIKERTGNITPQQKALLDTLISGNKQKISETATNLCQTYGTTQEEAANMAMDWFQNAMNKR